METVKRSVAARRGGEGGVDKWGTEDFSGIAATLCEVVIVAL